VPTHIAIRAFDLEPSVMRWLKLNSKVDFTPTKNLEQIYLPGTNGSLESPSVGPLERPGDLKWMLIQIEIYSMKFTTHDELG